MTVVLRDVGRKDFTQVSAWTGGEGAGTRYRGRMSRSDSTQPYRLRSTDMERRAATFSLPRKTGSYLRRQWQKGQRQAEREALRMLEEPEPARPRHSVIWNYW